MTSRMFGLSAAATDASAEQTRTMDDRQPRMKLGAVSLPRLLTRPQERRPDIGRFRATARSHGVLQFVAQEFNHLCDSRFTVGRQGPGVRTADEHGPRA